MKPCADLIFDEVLSGCYNKQIMSDADPLNNFVGSSNNQDFPMVEKVCSDFIESDAWCSKAKNCDELLKLYRGLVHSDGGLLTISSGGYQHYLNKESGGKSHGEIEESDIVNEFDSLPIDVQLLIFSKLEARDLCWSCQVSRGWNRVANDDVLWRKKLMRDLTTWNIIGSTTNPDTYRECSSESTSKEIYLRCCPTVNSRVRRRNANFHQLSCVLRSWLPKKAPRTAIFGPGLESSTSGLVRNILEDRNGPFVTVGMFPGQFVGIGSGFTVKLENSITFDLMTLYTSTRQEREKAQEGRLGRSRLLRAQQQRVDEEAKAVDYELQPALKSLCGTLDAIAFVVDASQGSSCIESDRAELLPMINEAWLRPTAPLLVLSCVPDASAIRLPCIDIVRCLQLDRLNRPWQVHDCVVDSFSGMVPAFRWLIERAQRN